MWDKVNAVWRVFRAGESVANPTAWKRGQITVAMLVTLGGAVLSLLHAFGVRFDLSSEQMASIFGAVLTIVGLFNHASTVVSTDKVNLLGMAHTSEGDVAHARYGQPDVAAVASATGGTAAVMPSIDTTAVGADAPSPDVFNAARNSGA